MAKPKRTTFPGHKVIATVKSVKGNCSWGHEAGDTFSINIHDTPLVSVAFSTMTFSRRL